MTFTNIRNEAYNIYTDPDRSEGARYNDMQKYLLAQVEAGAISATDKCFIARAIMETASL